MTETILFLAGMLFFMPWALKKMTRIYLFVPFFLLSLLIILHAGIFDRYSFVDSDLIFHKTLTDTILEPGSFRNDPAIQYYLKTYPRGYHSILALLSKFKLSVPQSSKLLGLIMALTIPFLFYFLSKEIYQDKQTAFLGGFFCGIASIGHTVYSGLPRSIGLVLFLSALLCLFKIKNSRQKIGYFFALNLLMLLLLAVHPHTFIVLWLVSTAFIVMLISRGDKHPHRKHYVFMFLLLIGYAVSCWIFKQKHFINLVTWDFMRQHQSVYANRVGYACMDLFRLIHDIGIMPLLIFCAALLKYIYEPDIKNKYPDTGFLFAAVFLLLIAVAAVINIDKLFFLKAHRFSLFISLFMYLSGVWLLRDIWYKIRTKKILLSFFCFILCCPQAVELREHIQAPRFPYDLNRICVGISRPEKDQPEFGEMLAAADYISRNTAKNALVACALDQGDILRMYAKRAVAASWEIGGMITTYKGAFFIYQQQIINSAMLYEQPLRLFQETKAEYFLWEKNKLKEQQDPDSLFKIIWQSKHLCIAKVQDAQ